MKKQVLLVLLTLLTISVVESLVVSFLFNISKTSNKSDHYVFANNKIQSNDDWNLKVIQNSFSIYTRTFIIERFKIKGLLYKGKYFNGH